MLKCIMEIFNEGEIVGAILQNVRYNLSLRKKTKKKHNKSQFKIGCSVVFGTFLWLFLIEAK